MNSIKKLSTLLKYNFIFRRNLVKYLRYCGAKIGSNCEIQNNISGFGVEPWLIGIR